MVWIICIEFVSWRQCWSICEDGNNIEILYILKPWYMFYVHWVLLMRTIKYFTREFEYLDEWLNIISWTKLSASTKFRFTGRFLQHYEVSQEIASSDLVHPDNVAILLEHHEHMMFTLILVGLFKHDSYILYNMSWCCEK